MISGSVLLAFTAGMVASFNPCGFSLLPAYIGTFVAGDGLDERLERRVARAVTVAAAVSLGFVLVFASVGLVIGEVAGEAQKRLPWVTIVIGALLALAGLAMVLGWKPSLAVRGPRFSTAANSGRVMVGYGVTYAIASLSCTIGPFLAVTGAALTGSPLDAVSTYVAYALGMGVIILIISVAAALAHNAVSDHLRRVSRHVPRVGGVLMILAGAYAVWYGRWELAVYRGDLAGDPIIDRAERIRLWFVHTIESIGATRLTLATVVVIVVILAVARAVHPPDRESAPNPTGRQGAPTR